MKSLMNELERMRQKCSWAFFRMKRRAVAQMRKTEFIRDIFCDFTKFIATFTVICFLTTSVFSQALYAVLGPDGAKSKQIEKKLGEFVIPYSLGRVTDGANFGTGSLIVVLQDLHCHPEVQRNIAKIIGLIEERYGLGDIYVEGAAGHVSTSWVNTIKDERLRKDIVDSLMDTGKLTGTEYFSITNGKNRALKGLEDKRIYEENLKRLGTILGMQPKVEEMLPEVKRKLKGLQERHFQRANKRLERMVEKNKEGELTTEKYYALLIKYAKKQKIDLNAYKNLTGYLEIINIGQELDYGRINKEMKDYLAALKEKMSYKNYSELVARAQDASKLDEFYLVLDKIFQLTDSKVGRGYPNLAKFLEFVNKNQAINPIALISEERMIVSELHRVLSESGAEREVAFLTGMYPCLEEFLKNKISCEDYEYFKSNLQAFETLWNKYVYEGKFPAVDLQMPVLSEFYSANVERNRCFIRNVIGSVPAQDAQIMVTPDTFVQSELTSQLKGIKKMTLVVAGGFHTTGISRLLKQTGASYIVITPNVTKETAFSEKVYNRIALKQAAEISAQTMALQLLSAEMANLNPDARQIEILKQAATAKITQMLEQNAGADPKELAEEADKKFREMNSSLTYVKKEGDRTYFAYKNSEFNVNLVIVVDKDNIASIMEESKKTAEPPADIKKAREAYRHIGISMGGNKVAVSINDGFNNFVAGPVEIRWDRDPRFSGGQVKKESKAEEVLDAVIEIIEKLIKQSGTERSKLRTVNSGLAGPLDEETGVFGTDFKTPNLPFNKFPFTKRLQEKLAEKRIKAKVSIYNDGKASLEGEHNSPKGKLKGKKGAIVIVGGGINIAADGMPNLEAGHNLVRRLNGHYEWVYEGSKGGHPIEKGNTEEEIIRKSGDMGKEFILLSEEAFKAKYPKYPIIDWGNGERDFEDRQKGPKFRERIAERIKFNLGSLSPSWLTNKEAHELAAIEATARTKYSNELERAVTDEALKENGKAKELIKEYAEEMGLALAAFIAAYADRKFVENLVLVSGVNENMGLGVYENDSDRAAGLDIYIKNIRKRAKYELINHYGMDASRAEALSEGIVRSEMTYERELVAHYPTDEEVLGLPEPVLTRNMAIQKATREMVRGWLPKWAPAWFVGFVSFWVAPFKENIQLITDPDGFIAGHFDTKNEKINYEELKQITGDTETILMLAEDWVTKMTAFIALSPAYLFASLLYLPKVLLAFGGAVRGEANLDIIEAKILVSLLNFAHNYVSHLLAHYVVNTRLFAVNVAILFQNLFYKAIGSNKRVSYRRLLIQEGPKPEKNALAVELEKYLIETANGGGRPSITDIAYEMRRRLGNDSYDANELIRGFEILLSAHNGFAGNYSIKVAGERVSVTLVENEAGPMIRGMMKKARSVGDVRFQVVQKNGSSVRAETSRTEAPKTEVPGTDKSARTSEPKKIEVLDAEDTEVVTLAAWEEPDILIQDATRDKVRAFLNKIFGRIGRRAPEWMVETLSFATAPLVFERRRLFNLRGFAEGHITSASNVDKIEKETIAVIFSGFLFMFALNLLAVNAIFGAEGTAAIKIVTGIMYVLIPAYDALHLQGYRRSKEYYKYRTFEIINPWMLLFPGFLYGTIVAHYLVNTLSLLMDIPKAMRIIERNPVLKLITGKKQPLQHPTAQRQVYENVLKTTRWLKSNIERVNANDKQFRSQLEILRTHLEELRNKGLISQEDVDTTIKGLANEAGKPEKERRITVSFKGEAIDVVTKDNKEAAVTELGLVHLLGLWHRTANVLILTNHPMEEKVLLIVGRRSPVKAYGGSLSIFGAHQRAGEKPTTTVSRVLVDQLRLPGGIFAVERLGRMVLLDESVYEKGNNKEFRSLWVIQLNHDESVLADQLVSIFKGRREEAAKYEGTTEYLGMLEKLGLGDIINVHGITIERIKEVQPDSNDIFWVTVRNDNGEYESVPFTRDLFTLVHPFLKPDLVQIAQRRKKVKLAEAPKDEIENVIGAIKRILANAITEDNQNELVGNISKLVENVKKTGMVDLRVASILAKVLETMEYEKKKGNNNVHEVSRRVMHAFGEIGPKKLAPYFMDMIRDGTIVGYASEYLLEVAFVAVENQEDNLKFFESLTVLLIDPKASLPSKYGIVKLIEQYGTAQSFKILRKVLDSINPEDIEHDMYLLEFYVAVLGAVGKVGNGSDSYVLRDFIVNKRFPGMADFELKKAAVKALEAIVKKGKSIKLFQSPDERPVAAAMEVDIKLVHPQAYKALKSLAEKKTAQKFTPEMKAVIAESIVKVKQLTEDPNNALRYHVMEELLGSIVKRLERRIEPSGERQRAELERRKKLMMETMVRLAEEEPEVAPVVVIELAKQLYREKDALQVETAKGRFKRIDESHKMKTGETVVLETLTRELARPMGTSPIGEEYETIQDLKPGLEAVINAIGILGPEVLKGKEVVAHLRDILTAPIGNDVITEPQLHLTNGPVFDADIYVGAAQILGDLKDVESLGILVRIRNDGRLNADIRAAAEIAIGKIERGEPGKAGIILTLPETVQEYLEKHPGMRRVHDSSRIGQALVRAWISVGFAPAHELPEVAAALASR
ncbi:MAG: ROK family protein, partial [Endomicrobiales bacterium]|nr:ROK family protein [Endomicrobiales bacterium]